MNKKDMHQFLESLNANLKAEIETSHQSLRDAQSITRKINKLFNKASDLIGKLENPQEGVEAQLHASASQIEAINSSVNSARDALSIINEHTSEVEQKISTMELAYENFNLSRARIENPDSGLQAILTIAKQYKAQIQSSATQAHNLEDKIKQRLASIQQSVESMVNTYAEFEEIKLRIENPDSGLQAILDSSQSLKDEISALNKDGQTLYTEIARYKDQAAKNAASIQAIKDQSNSTLDAILQHEVDSQETKERISRIFELVSQSGHANYFDTRRKKLIQASWGWLGAGLSGVIVAVLMAIELLLPLFPMSETAYSRISFQEEIGILVLRTSIITPVVAFTVYSFRQYGKERKLAEQYAFKSVSASTIEGSIALIERSLKSVPSEHLNTQLADFAIKTAHSLHSEPQELQKLSKFSFLFGSKLANLGTEINESLEGINKDIKDVIASTKNAKNDHS